MSDSEKVTIEEWAEEHRINLNHDQIIDLLEALYVCKEADAIQFEGVPTDSELKVEILEKKVSMLESFIRSKGYSIDINNSSITEFKQARITDSHFATDRINHYF